MKLIYIVVLLLAGPLHALERLPYNHPGLVVDLGVGLWAWPVPCDADGDGDYDLIVSCPDKPSNGIWLFENAVGDTPNATAHGFASEAHTNSTSLRAKTRRFA